MSLENPGARNERGSREEYPQPEMQIIPAVPEKEIVPDGDKIPPEVRQQIIDDIDKQEKEEREREERINEIIRKRKQTEGD